MLTRMIYFSKVTFLPIHYCFNEFKKIMLNIRLIFSIKLSNELSEAKSYFDTYFKPICLECLFRTELPLPAPIFRRHLFRESRPVPRIRRTFKATLFILFIRLTFKANFKLYFFSKGIGVCFETFYVN